MPIFAPVLRLLLFESLLELIGVAEEEVWVANTFVWDFPEGNIDDVEAEFAAIEALPPDVIEVIEAEFSVVKELLLYVAGAAPEVTCAIRFSNGLTSTDQFNTAVLQAASKHRTTSKLTEDARRLEAISVWFEAQDPSLSPTWPDWQQKKSL
jgi:hypothetical protein